MIMYQVIAEYPHDSTQWFCMMTENILLKLFIIQGCVSSWRDFRGPSLITLFFCLLTSPSTEKKKLVLLFNKISSFLEFIFNWRITALQYRIGFHHTSTCISHRHMHVPSLPPPNPSHTSRLSQSA